MALTLTSPSPLADDVWGRLRVAIRTVTFDDSYPTGGESLTAADVGMAEIVGVIVLPDHSPAYSVTYDYANGKLVVSGVQQDADAATTDPFDEEDDTADLDTLVCRVIVLGV